MIVLAVSIDKAVIAKLRIGGKKFEILVDPRMAFEIAKGKSVSWDDVLAYPAIYRDARASEVAAERDIQSAFGTTDVFKVAEQIIKRGELQLTTEQRRELIQQKKRQIANLIAQKAVNPQTNLPHPPQRILNAMEKVGISVDPLVDAELQVDKVLKAIKPLIPIKFQKVLLRLRIQPQFSGRVYPLLKKSAEIVEEKWLNDGSLELEVEVFVGLRDELFKKLADLTHGQFESKVLRSVDI